MTHFRAYLAGLWAALVLAAFPVAAQTQIETQDTEPTLAPLPTPSLNFYGVPGLIDMPGGGTLPDGQFTLTYSFFGGTSRYSATFQALPWLSGTFRYNSIRNWNLGGFRTYYDRGFDVRFRLKQESRFWPEITLGLQDFIGTGIYASEYIVATKQFNTPALSPGRLPGRLSLTAGVGWGRLGSYNSFGSPFGANRPGFDPSSVGGEVAYEQWFRGPASLFGGFEYRPDDRWALKAEYSTDAYRTETQRTNVFERKSSVNFGLEYQATRTTRLGLYYLYGSELGFSAQFQLNPRFPPVRLAAPAPGPIQPRPARAQNPEAYSEEWVASASVPLGLRAQVTEALRSEGLTLEHLTLRANSAELRFRNTRYRSESIAIGRAARVLAAILPASVETLRLVPVQGGLARVATTMRRSDLEALEFQPNATEALLAVTGIGEAGPVPA
ncbi:MAG: YjbH domain-containing protein, partial [Leisingera sp.]